ncbi:hypothetical protein BC349_12660 [Flavihumibacter stibioxidans]|uniref:Lipopolysaccharide kinase (Kdo/WaaP) family protein n=1 Tax=Flavihumibacter stibioxidans TaxID=1834163 RepID=A0ABR7MAD9_9BACT|nr:hypothetical protein [Flavihumibacter stibioxidans]
MQGKKLFLPSLSEEFQFLQTLQRKLLLLLEAINTEHTRSGIAHLDNWFDNINIGNNKQITIFDFCLTRLTCV